MDGSENKKRVYCKDCRWMTDLAHCGHPDNFDTISTHYSYWNSQKQRPIEKNAHNNCKDFSPHRNILEKIWRRFVQLMKDY